ncbi:MAG: Type IV pilus biogenesis protein PilM [Candidatus Ozemobacter sibiricus]|jgi:Tfp pilus assembly PilM family ATPase|uniref:Type IV pilus biogenesis protein PilM n=1 Tax=Candidatus Ozemobacter sibiricus TaxID=2268124 RepID=A0A367ZS21_9BACT|nr:MAG: Type IV pilus biogenesis protein PilM [Candidatus Ozemobacter sibiricus]
MNLFTEFFALDLGTRSIKAFSVNPGSGGEGYVVADAIHHPLPLGLVTGGFTNPVIRSGADLAAELRQVLGRLSSHKDGCILGLPDRWVKLHLVDLVLKPHELNSRDFLSWRLRRTLNLPEGLDVVIDHQILGIRQEEEGLACQILAAAVRRDLLVTLSSLLADLHVELMAIDTSTLGVYNLLEEQHPENTLDRSLIMCHIGHETTVTKFFNSGRLIYERVIEVAGEEFTRLVAEVEHLEPAQAEAAKESRKFFPQTKAEVLEQVLHRETLRKVFGNWLRELNVTFRFYQDKFKVMRLPKIYLTGGSSLFPGLPEFLTDFFETPVERFNPVAGIPSPGPIDDRVNALGALFAPSLGLLVR